MTKFSEARERLRKRVALVQRVVTESIGDPDLRVVVARAEHLQTSSLVTMRITLCCDFLVHDDASEPDIRRRAPGAYKKLATHARAHFFDHLGTDPNQKVPR